MILSGLSSVIFMIAGLIGKFNAFPGSAAALTLSLVCFSLVFLPILFFMKIKEKNTRAEKIQFIAGGFSAIRCGVMSQQLLASTQFGPTSGGTMTGGFRVWTVTGATVSVIVAGNNGGCGCATETPIACTNSAGTVAPGSSATSSHTAADWDGPSFVVAVGFPMTRVQ